ncbi:hypothetical protein GK675_02155 [Bifidobacteriaceae bacterium NR002]|nr:hypothetical protein [Bifidobacteriaceae bacterium NR002]
MREPHTTPKVSKSTDGMKPTFNAGRLLLISIANIYLSHNFVCVLNLIYIDSVQVYQNCCVKETVLIRQLNFIVENL